MKKPLKLGYLSVSDADKTKKIQEEFSSEVDDKVTKFPVELGAEHPFEFEDAEKVYKSFGVATGACNKLADNIVGEFSIKCQDDKARILIDGFIKDSNLQVHLREWILEALIKGNGFMELDLKANKVKVINANSMFVVRDKKGNVKGYNQYTGLLNKFNLNSRKLISFLPDKIAHLTINRISGDPYGQGILMPNEKIIELLMQNEMDLHKLIGRKAGQPIHVKVGREGEIVDPSVVDSIKNSLVYMTNRTEWVTDANVQMDTLDFGDIGKNLTDTLNHDLEMLSAGMEIPVVLFGSGQLNEGIAKVQLEGFKLKIQSIQEDIETIVEQKIFKPLLLSNKIQADVEFIWNLPGEEEINNRLTQLNSLLQNPYLSDGMRKAMQIEMGRLLNFTDPDLLVNTPNTQGMTADKNPVFSPDGKVYEPKQQEDKSNENERKKEENIKQPEMPGEKVKQENIVTIKEESVNKEKNSCCKHHINESDLSNMSIKEFVNLVEVAGFNYSDYLINILKRLKTEKFEDLRAITEKDVENGLLTEEQTNKLRQILKDGFRKNKSIKEIEDEIKNNLALKDRISENGTVIPADLRPNMISRTETIRMANLGLIDTYKENNIQKVRWLAALSDRTCEICNAHNGEVFNIEEAYNLIPAHVNCRCSLLSITE